MSRRRTGIWAILDICLHRSRVNLHQSGQCRCLQYTHLIIYLDRSSVFTYICDFILRYRNIIVLSNNDTKLQLDRRHCCWSGILSHKGCSSRTQQRQSIEASVQYSTLPDISVDLPRDFLDCICVWWRPCSAESPN